MARPVPRQRWVVMGVSGTGKSAVGERLAERLGARFIEGDDDHPPENIAKMKAGQPLSDADRQAWLAILRDRLHDAAHRGESVVLTCSALKRRYRDQLREGDPDVRLIHLHGDRALIASRMAQRSRHFMPESLLDSQLRDLEPPAPEERAIRLDIRHPPEALVEQVIQAISDRPG